MDNCIFSAHCTEHTCDKSCPILSETSYLLERNDIKMSSPAFHRSKKYIDMTLNTLTKAKGTLATIVSENTVGTAELVTYCAICQNWKGSQLHCNVYNLKFSKYIDSIKKSWSSRTEPESLEYMRIWAESSKVLIISNLDFINLGDFECQTLLSLIQSRSDPEFTTIVVCPPLNMLVGKGVFFGRLQKILKGGTNL